MSEPSYFALHYLMVAKSPGARIIRSEPVTSLFYKIYRPSHKQLVKCDSLNSTIPITLPKSFVVSSLIVILYRIIVRDKLDLCCKLGNFS